MQRRIRLHSQTVPRTKHAINLAALASAGLPIGAVGRPWQTLTQPTTRHQVRSWPNSAHCSGFQSLQVASQPHAAFSNFPARQQKTFRFKRHRKGLMVSPKCPCPCSLLAAASAIPHLCRFSPRVRVGIDYDDDYVSQRQLFLCRMPLLQERPN